SITVSRGRGQRTFHTASCWRSARFSSASLRCVRTAARSVRMRIRSHLTMTGHYPDQPEKRKKFATDDFLERTGQRRRPLTPCPCVVAGARFELWKRPLKFEFFLSY